MLSVYEVQIQELFTNEKTYMTEQGGFGYVDKYRPTTIYSLS